MSGTHLVDGMKEFIITNKEKVLAIVTGSFRSIVTSVLTFNKVSKYFDFIIDASDVKIQKPNPESYFLAIEKANSKPSETIIFEDSEKGVIAGKLSGAFVVAIPNELTIKNDFSEADLIIKSISDFSFEKIESLRP